MSISSRGSLISLSLSMLLASLGTSIANVSLPSLAQAFDASFHAVQWVVLAYLLAITAVRSEEHTSELQSRLHPYAVFCLEHTSELQSRLHLVCRLLLEKKN